MFAGTRPLRQQVSTPDRGGRAKRAGKWGNCKSLICDMLAKTPMTLRNDGGRIIAAVCIGQKCSLRGISA
jgi:hypothetical protein